MYAIAVAMCFRKSSASLCTLLNGQTLICELVAGLRAIVGNMIAFLMHDIVTAYDGHHKNYILLCIKVLTVLLLNIGQGYFA